MGMFHVPFPLWQHQVSFYVFIHSLVIGNESDDIPGFGIQDPGSGTSNHLSYQKIAFRILYIHQKM